MENSVESLLENDHESLGQLLTELNLSLSTLDVSRSFELLDLFWARLAIHLRAEHLHLFPALADAPRTLDTGKDDVPGPQEVHELINQLRLDHDFFMKELADMIRVMRDMTTHQRVDQSVLVDLSTRLMRITSRLDVHNELEEAQVYKWVGLIFDAETLADLGRRIQHELDNLPPRFI
jgi:hypothetical protein